MPIPSLTLLPSRSRHLHRDLPKPEWHAPWKLMRVISGHLGWVRAIAVDPTNDWFVTGSADRTIKARRTFHLHSVGPNTSLDSH